HRRVAKKHRATDEGLLRSRDLSRHRRSIELVDEQNEIVGRLSLLDAPAFKMVQVKLEIRLRTCERRKQRWKSHEQCPDHQGFDGLHNLTSWHAKQFVSTCVRTWPFATHHATKNTSSQADMPGGLRATTTNKHWNEHKIHIHPMRTYSHMRGMKTSLDE